MIWHSLQPVLVFVIVFLASVFSGMAGGGGGFIVLPFLIALGLSPQQAVATAKLSAFGLGLGSVAAFKKKAFAYPRLLTGLVIMSGIVSFFVPHVFRSINGKTFQLLIGIIILALVPIIIAEKTGIKRRRMSTNKKIVGTILMAIVLFMQGVLSGGIGAINNVVLISFFGLSSLQANATRRVITLALNTFIVISLATSTNFIVYRLAIAGMAGSIGGGYIGSEIALKEGEKFARYALMVLMIVSGVWLIASA